MVITQVMSSPLDKYYCINVKSNNEVKKRIIALLDWLATDEGIMKAWFGEENKTYKLNNNIIELTFSGASTVDCIFGVITNDVNENGLEGKFKEFYNYALGRPFFMASPDWKNYQGRELNVFTQSIELMKDTITIDYITETDIKKKTNEKYFNIYDQIVKRESQFFEYMRSIGWRDLEIEYKKLIEDIEKIGIHELLDYLNDRIN